LRARREVGPQRDEEAHELEAAVVGTVDDELRTRRGARAPLRFDAIERGSHLPADEGAIGQVPQGFVEREVVAKDGIGATARERGIQADELGLVVRTQVGVDQEIVEQVQQPVVPPFPRGGAEARQLPRFGERRELGSQEAGVLAGANQRMRVADVMTGFVGKQRLFAVAEAE
jgi:hypothetical protein